MVVIVPGGTSAWDRRPFHPVQQAVRVLPQLSEGRRRSNPAQHFLAAPVDLQGDDGGRQVRHIRIVPIGQPEEPEASARACKAFRWSSVKRPW